MGLFDKFRKSKSEAKERQANEKNEISNAKLKENIATAAITTLHKEGEYSDLAFTNVEFGYLFTIEGHGVEALFKVITDRGTYYFAAQKTSVLRLNINEALFSETTKQFLELHGSADIGWEEMPDDTARRERSISILKEKGIPYLPQLYVIVSEAEAQIRRPEEISRRVLAMFGVCAYSEVRGGGESWNDSQKYLHKMNDILNGKLDQSLTPMEKHYLAEKEPDQSAIAKFGWRYECCHVLLWVLGIIEELGFPNEICNVSQMGKIIWRLNDINGFLENIKFRDREEILDMADLILRYDWACVDARINGRESPAGLDGEVVQEWHYAFEWLVGSNERVDWDDVTIST